MPAPIEMAINSTKREILDFLNHETEIGFEGDYCPETDSYTFKQSIREHRDDREFYFLFEYFPRTPIVLTLAQMNPFDDEPNAPNKISSYRLYHVMESPGEEPFRSTIELFNSLEGNLNESVYRIIEHINDHAPTIVDSTLVFYELQRRRRQRA